MPQQPQQPVPAPTLDQLVAQIIPVAQQLGVATLVIIGRDPRTGAARVFGSNEAMTDLRELVEEKFGFGGETGWNDTLGGM